MSVKPTKITVWIDTSPGGIDWDISRKGMGRFTVKREGPFSTRAVLVIPKPKTNKK